MGVARRAPHPNAAGLFADFIALDEWDKWSALWSSLFLGGKAVKRDD